MRCIAICAFREPFDGGFVEAMYPGAEVDVPSLLVAKLAADGHIVSPPSDEEARPDDLLDDTPADDEAPQPGPMPEAPSDDDGSARPPTTRSRRRP